MMPIRRPARALLAACCLLAAPVAHAQRGPAPVSVDLPPEVLGLACAPRAAYEAPPTPLRVTGGQDATVRRAHAPGDLVTINAGRMNGIEVGQEYYVRRLQTSGRNPVTRRTPGTIRTTGWIRVYAIDDEMSLATITHACDTIEINDYLEPFSLPAVPAASTERFKPERDNYGRVMAGTDRRRSFGKGDYVLVDRGADFGITPGALFVFYRDKRQPENFLYELGEATAVEVKEDTATLLITLSRDAIEEGDYVSERKPPQQ
jgi:hypothetical protein